MNINESLKTLKTEMTLVTSEYIGNEKSVESLTAQNDVLSRTIYKLKERLAAQQKMLNESTAAYGEADLRTQKWQQAVNITTAELNKARAAMDKNNVAFALMGEVEEVVSATTETLRDSMDELGISMSKLTVAGVVGLTIAALESLVSMMSEAITSATEYADNILTLSTNYGIATDSLQAYQYMAELTDTSVETITGSISRLTRSMNSARDGSGETAEAFARLNIRITESDGQLRDSEEVFNDVIGALGMMSNETERDAIAQTLLGRSAMELNSLIAVGKDGIAAYTAEAEAMRYILSGEQLEALDAVDDQFQRMDKMMEAVKNRITVEMAPALIELTEYLLQIAMQVDWEAFGQAAAATIRALTPTIVNLAAGLATLANAFASLMNAISGTKLPSVGSGRSGALSLPGLAEGGVVEPNNPALYILGDNTREREIVAPESLMRQIARESGGGRVEVVVRNPSTTDNQIVRALTPEIDVRTAQRGLVL